MIFRKRKEEQEALDRQEKLDAAMRSADAEKYKRAMESSIATAAQRLSDAVDQEVMDKLLKEASTPMATTVPATTLDEVKVKKVLATLCDERIEVNLYVSSRAFEAQVRVFFPDFSYAHELGPIPRASIEELEIAFDGALEGLQDHIERNKEMEAWL